MRTWKQWRGAFLIFALSCAIFSMSATKPAAAYPALAEPDGSCPATLSGLYTYVPITSGFLVGYCQETAGPINFCPPGYTQTTIQSPLHLPVPVCIPGGTYLPPSTGDLTVLQKYTAMEMQITLKEAIQKYVANENDNGIDNGGLTHNIAWALGTGGGGGSRLGMSVPGGPADQIDAGGFGGGSVIRGNVGITDSAGITTPGMMTGFKDVSGIGSIYGSYQVSGLPANQWLSLSGAFDYQRHNISVAPITGLAGASGGSAGADTYTFQGSAFYSFGSSYVRGAAGFDVGRGNETSFVDGSTGNFNTHGYAGDLRIGTVFGLLNTIKTASPAAMPTKAPPKSTSGYAVGLDLSGHVGYSDQRLDGFTDSTGLIFGSGDTHSGDVGARARLFAVVQDNGWLWVPYVSATVDQQFGFSSVLNIPNQAAFVGGDVFSFQEAKTFWGTELGLNVQGPFGLTIGAKGFYQASADISFVGGTAYVKVPLNYTPKPAFASRY